MCHFILTFTLVVATLVSSSLSDRLQYHQQGLKDAPSHVSYRFGYIAGDKENPQSRHEISYEPGYVTGAYTFIDANNKLQYVKYEAHPEHGFRIVDQWTKDAAEDNNPAETTNVEDQEQSVMQSQANSV